MCQFPSSKSHNGFSGLTPKIPGPERGQDVLIDPPDCRHAHAVAVGRPAGVFAPVREVFDALEGGVLGGRHGAEPNTAVAGSDDELETAAATSQQTAGDPVESNLQPL